MKRRFLLTNRLPLLATVATIVFAATPIHAGVLFTESFETPDITGYVQGNTPATNWVRAAQGFNSSFHGLIDQEVDGAGVGLEFTAPSTQGYAFRYTNSGITTASGKIAALQWGVTYTVSVDVVKDIVGATGLPYTIQLIAIAPGAARDDCRATPTGSTILNSAAGNAPAGGTVQTITFNFTPNPVTHAALAGYDLGVRFVGASDSANIDNVQVSATDPPIAYWDINGTTPGAGGPAATGTWDGTAANWNPAADGTGTSAAWATGQAIFAAGTDASDPYTVTVDGSRDINLLAFEEGTVTLANGASGALNLTGDTPVTVASGLSAMIATNITEDVAGRQLIKLGAGTLTLAGNSSYTGATTVVQGTLLLSGADNSAATGGMTLNGGLTRFNTLASINGTTRNVTLNAGATLAFEPAFGITDIPTALSTRIVAASAGTIAADNYAAENFDFNTPGLTAAYLGAVGNFSYTGTLTPNGTTYRIGGGGGTLTMANANALTGAGSSAVIRGNVVLAAANDLVGGVTLNSGILTIGNNGSLGSGTFTIAGGSTVQASGTVVTTNAVAANADFTVAGTDALTLGNLTLNANRAVTNNNTTTTTTLGAITGANRSLTFNGSGNTTVPGAITTGTGTLTKNSAGYLTLSGANTYSGTTTINGGRLILEGSNSSAGQTVLILNQLHLASASNGGLPSGALTFGNGTQFNAIIQAVGADRAITNNLILNNTHGSVSGDYSLTVNGTFTNSAGNRTLTNGTVSGKVLTLAGQVNLSNDGTTRILTITGAGNTIISGIIANGSTSTAGALVKSGSGTLTLTNDNTYAGTTTVNTGGTLALVGGSQNSAITVNSGAFLGFTLGSPTTSSKALNLNTGHAIRITGTPTLASYTLITAASIGGTGTPTLEAPISGYELVVDGTSLKLNSTGAPTGYAAWQAANGTAGTRDQDHDGDGVDNGTEHFLGGDSNTTGFTALPTVVNTAGTLSVTWTKDVDYAGAYTTDFVVETSATLAGPWTTESVGVNVTITGNNVTYTFPGGPAYSGKNFARLKVTGP